MSQQQPRLRLISEANSAPSDGALLARVASGDVSALGRIYDSYAAMLLRFARRLGAGDEAEDIVQNVFLRVVRLAPAFDVTASSARPWLFAITVRVVQERRRSLRRLASAMSALAMQKHAPTLTAPPMASDLERCLHKLTLAKRSVILLAEVEGFSCDEIAAMLDIPVGTVWTRLHHARRELRESWGETP
ncbi:MAG: polymerase sigma-54 factor RpoN [Myxococcaceae bacterium]|nr:polymerase sigma-54 factor RpoN [Myxococcaceae bacterium]